MQHIKEIIKITKHVCFKCSKLLINKNQHKHILDYPPEKRWNYINNLSLQKNNVEDAIKFVSKNYNKEIFSKKITSLISTF